MKLPQSMAQVVTDGQQVSDYEIILPKGEYTSGTYTIPNGRTWNSFKILIGVLGRGANERSSATLLDEQFTSLSWKADMNPDSDGSGAAYIRRASSTTFTVGRVGAARISMLIGYLK